MTKGQLQKHISSLNIDITIHQHSFYTMSDAPSSKASAQFQWIKITQLHKKKCNHFHAYSSTSRCFALSKYHDLIPKTSTCNVWSCIRDFPMFSVHPLAPQRETERGRARRYIHAIHVQSIRYDVLTYDKCCSHLQ